MPYIVTFSLLNVIYFLFFVAGYIFWLRHLGNVDKKKMVMKICRLLKLGGEGECSWLVRMWLYCIYFDLLLVFRIICLYRKGKLFN